MILSAERTDCSAVTTAAERCKAAVNWQQWTNTVFFNPGPRDPLSCMFSMFLSSNTPDSNEWLLIRPLQRLMTS